MIRALRLLGCAALVAAVAACGFTGNLRRNPGFASFGAPSPRADRKLALSLGPVPIRLATLLSRPFVGRDKPWIPTILKDVRAVRVYSYEIDGDEAGALAHFDTARSKLIADGWNPIVAVREDGGLVAALVLSTEPKRIRGVVVMYQEDDQLVLVNVIGKLEPKTFGAAMAHLGLKVPAMSVSETSSDTSNDT